MRVRHRTIRPSPNEEKAIRAADMKMRRIKRIQQVALQEKQHAVKTRKAFNRKREEHVSDELQTLRSEFEQRRQTKELELRVEYEKALEELGRAHQLAIQTANQRHEDRVDAEKRRQKTETMIKHRYETALQQLYSTLEIEQKAQEAVQTRRLEVTEWDNSRRMKEAERHKRIEMERIRKENEEPRSAILIGENSYNASDFQSTTYHFQVQKESLPQKPERGHKAPNTIGVERHLNDLNENENALEIAARDREEAEMRNSEKEAAKIIQEQQAKARHESALERQALRDPAILEPLRKAEMSRRLADLQRQVAHSHREMAKQRRGEGSAEEEARKILEAIQLGKTHVNVKKKSKVTAKPITLSTPVSLRPKDSSNEHEHEHENVDVDVEEMVKMEKMKMDKVQIPHPHPSAPNDIHIDIDRVEIADGSDADSTSDVDVDTDSNAQAVDENKDVNKKSIVVGVGVADEEDEDERDKTARVAAWAAASDRLSVDYDVPDADGRFTLGSDFDADEFRRRLEKLRAEEKAKWDQVTSPPPISINVDADHDQNREKEKKKKKAEPVSAVPLPTTTVFRAPSPNSSSSGSGSVNEKDKSTKNSQSYAHSASTSDIPMPVPAPLQASFASLTANQHQHQRQYRPPAGASSSSSRAKRNSKTDVNVNANTTVNNSTLMDSSFLDALRNISSSSGSSGSIGSSVEVERERVKIGEKVPVVLAGGRPILVKSNAKSQSSSLFGGASKVKIPAPSAKPPIAPRSHSRPLPSPSTAQHARPKSVKKGKAKAGAMRVKPKVRSEKPEVKAIDVGVDAASHSQEELDDIQKLSEATGIDLREVIDAIKTEAGFSSSSSGGEGGGRSHGHYWARLGEDKEKESVASSVQSSLQELRDEFEDFLKGKEKGKGGVDEKEEEEEHKPEVTIPVPIPSRSKPKPKHVAKSSVPRLREKPRPRVVRRNEAQTQEMTDNFIHSFDPNGNVQEHQHEEEKEERKEYKEKKDVDFGLISIPSEAFTNHRQRNTHTMASHNDSGKGKVNNDDLPITLAIMDISLPETPLQQPSGIGEIKIRENGHTVPRPEAAVTKKKSGLRLEFGGEDTDTNLQEAYSQHKEARKSRPKPKGKGKGKGKAGNETQISDAERKVIAAKNRQRVKGLQDRLDRERRQRQMASRR